jgi:hypothetical protein
VANPVILWRRRDQPGHEYAQLLWRAPSWHLIGTAVFAHARQPCRLDYEVVCDAAWRTLSARVSGWVGDVAVQIEVMADAARRWRLNGAECAGVAGCIDLDLNFSPATNTLPIRRLGLGVGEEAEVQAAWLRFPSFTLERLDQRYRRLEASTYRYTSGSGRFAADLEVNAAGFVTRYADVWHAEAVG